MRDGDTIGAGQPHAFMRARVHQRVMEDRVTTLRQRRQQGAVGGIAIGKEQRAFAAEKGCGLAFEQFMFFVVAA